jgi:hypothetical protein
VKVNGGDDFVAAVDSDELTRFPLIAASAHV